MRAIATHANNSKTALLIDRKDILEEKAVLILSSVSMNLFTQEYLDVSKGSKIFFAG